MQYMWVSSHYVYELNQFVHQDFSWLLSDYIIKNRSIFQHCRVMARLYA